MSRQLSLRPCASPGAGVYRKNDVFGELIHGADQRGQGSLRRHGVALLSAKRMNVASNPRAVLVFQWPQYDSRTNKRTGGALFRRRRMSARQDAERAQLARGA